MMGTLKAHLPFSLEGAGTRVQNGNQPAFPHRWLPDPSDEIRSYQK